MVTNPKYQFQRVHPKNTTTMEEIITYEKQNFGKSVLEVEANFGEPYALTINDTFAGYAIYGQIWIPEVNDAYISRIAIDPKLRRQGLGSYIIKQIIKDLKTQDCNSIQGDINKTNKASQALFQKHGFKLKKDFDQPTSYKDFHRYILTLKEE